MYTVPAKVPVQAKKLIECFEKGRPAVVDSDDDEVIGGAAVEAPVAADTKPKRRVRSEVSVDELAQPGTALKLLREFESISQAAATARSPPPRGNRASRGEGAPPVVAVVAAAAEASADQHHDEISAAHHPETASAAAHHAVAEAITDHCHENHFGDHDAVEVAVDVHNEVAESIEQCEHAAEAVEVADHVEAVPASAACAENGAADAKKTVLIVIAVEDKTPLDWKLFGAGMSKLEEQHCEVLMTDATRIVDRNAEFSVEEDREKMMKADLVIFHTQPVLHCIPAALLYWVESVFSLQDPSAIDLGRLHGKKCVVLLTMPHQQTKFSGAGDLGDISLYLWPLQAGILRHLGLAVLPPQIVFGVPGDKSDMKLDDEVSNRMKDEWAARLDSVWNDAPTPLRVIAQ